ncbi:UDP-glucuronosyltransferase 2B17-like isoform X3 [Perognathus longimembris pacificus]|uniref:UDP-glucuronosyltransferase 2B17-like isoform X3 n=1 Tax=Perognathus longimembris pacificus TaxID=214514 RepID=UPI0020191100|nr:UDP-glucuronosyltransferase 2B17-like isoform X3 [Perognathus longimembris pacificus]
MPGKWIWVLLLLHLSCYFSSGSCGKVLVWPMEYSHWINMKVILDELILRGHEITVVRSSSAIFVGSNETSSMKFETFPSSFNTDEMIDIISENINLWTYELPRTSCLAYSPLLENLFMKFSDTWLNICKEAALNKELMSKLRKARLDVLIADPIGPCGEPTTLMETTSRAEIWLIRSYWDLEFPRPTLPNFDFVGGLHCRPAKPLPKEMEDFVQSSGDNGVVVFSLGSMGVNLTDKTANAIASALAQIPQKIIWRFEGKKPVTLGPNTRLYKWLPQNDLLGHPKTKAFITHGGANGIYEAIHHGVPMVGIPLFGEQHDNIAHMVAKGAAVQLDIRTLSSKDLLRALETVINNPLYKKNAMWLSTIHHDQPMKPLDRAVFWIEFVMRHKGAKHLRPLAHNLTWYQYYSLDVIGFLLACVATVTFLVIKCCLLAYQTVFKMGKKKKRE